jgi:hypothetical protein
MEIVVGEGVADLPGMGVSLINTTEAITCGDDWLRIQADRKIKATRIIFFIHLTPNLILRTASCLG